MSKQYLVRISPNVEVESYNQFTKAAGWQGPVDETTANYLKTVKTGDHQPNLPCVFEVATVEQAQVLHEAETTVVAARVGTPSAPLPIAGLASSAMDGQPQDAAVVEASPKRK